MQSWRVFLHLTSWTCLLGILMTHTMIIATQVTNNLCPIASLRFRKNCHRGQRSHLWFLSAVYSPPGTVFYRHLLKLKFAIDVPIAAESNSCACIYIPFLLVSLCSLCRVVLLSVKSFSWVTAPSCFLRFYNSCHANWKFTYFSFWLGLSKSHFTKTFNTFYPASAEYDVQTPQKSHHHKCYLALLNPWKAFSLADNVPLHF